MVIDTSQERVYFSGVVIMCIISQLSLYCGLDRFLNSLGGIHKYGLQQNEVGDYPIIMGGVVYLSGVW